MLMTAQQRLRATVEGPNVQEPKSDAEPDEMYGKVASALAEGRMALAYQPVVASRCFQKIAFHEALLRLVEDDGTTLPACAFLPSMQDHDMIVALDRMALRRAIQALKADLRLKLSVNITGESLASRDWLDLLRFSEKAMPGLGSRLLVEVSECVALRDPDATGRFVEKLRWMGGTIALDRLRDGNESLSSVRQLGFDVVKIDCALLRGNAERRCNAAALVRLARRHGVPTVAELVEKVEEAKFASDLGIDLLQGHHVSRPLPVWVH
jgi:EAL domain-containing protein (putative c-di-GMP-specific phosphodiesterase class I)